MADKNIELSLKITADLNQARQNVARLNDEISRTATETQSSNTKTARSWQDVAAAQTDAMNRAARAGNAQQQQAKMQEAAAKAAERQRIETEKLKSGLDKLIGSIDPAVQKLGKLDAQEEKLRKTHKAGIIDNDTFSDYLDKITAQRDALGSIQEATQKTALGTKTARREVTQLFRQIASGNISGVGNTLLSLGNTTGKLPPLFGAATLAIGATTAALAAFGYVIHGIITDNEKFSRAIITTGNASGTTAAVLEASAQRIGKINGEYAKTREILAQLTSTGRLSAESIDAIAAAAANMSALTGQSANDSIAHFDGIENSVTQWAETTNKQYHFLDLATYQRIRALEEQGKTEEAIAVATEKYSAVVNDRVREMQQELNWLEKAWQSFRRGVAEVGNGLRQDLKIATGLSSINDEIAKLERAKQSGGYVIPGAVLDWNERMQSELDTLYKKRDAEIQNAQAQRQNAIATEKAISASKALSERHKAGATDAEKQRKQIQELNKEYQALWADEGQRYVMKTRGVTSKDGKTFSGGQYDEDVKSITDKELKNYNKTLEQTIATQGKSTNLARVQYEIESGKFKNASEAEKKRAIALAKQADAYKEQNQALKAVQSSAKKATADAERFVKALETKAAKSMPDTFLSRAATIDKTGLSGDYLARARAANQQIAEAENKKINTELQSQLNQLINNGFDTKRAELDKWYSELIAKLKGNENQQGISLIDQILPKKEAMFKVAEIQEAIQKIEAAQSNKSQLIQADSTAGLISQTEAQQRLLTLHHQTADALREYIPELEKVAQIGGSIGESADKALSALRLQVAELKSETDILTTAFKDGLQSGIAGVLKGLADRTRDLKTAILELMQTVVSSMANVAAQGLADIAMKQLDGLFSNTDDDALAAVEMGTAITTASTIGATEFSTTMAAAFAMGATTIASAITAASAGNSVSSGAGALFSTVFAATGGLIQGAGTATSDSIPARLSNGEYVVNAAAVRAVGVDYLHAINSRKTRPFATGGIVSPTRSPFAPAQSQTRKYQQDGAESATAAPVIQQTLVIDGGEVFSAGINSVRGKRDMLTFVRANAPTFKQILGV